ncbi:MAG TPA: MBL fold metallo-hydrolase [Flavobacteriales bacterium]|nr:MBL fold metallo-hydrolase [Flavobacteriales bacterium]
MRLVFLGTGTSQGVPVIACTCEVCRSIDPRDKRTRSSALVEVDGRRILIDAGPELRVQLLREQVMDLDAVLLTHEHMDHIAGLDDLRAFSLVHEPPRAMDIYASGATVEAIKRVFSYAFSKHKYPGVPEFAMHTIEGPFQAAGVDVVPIEVMHLLMPVLGFRIGGLVYITDAKTIAPAEREKMQGADVLVLNALRRKKHISHLNLEEALELVAELKPKRTYLTHISHLMGCHADVELPPGVELAYDGLKVDL